MTQKELLYIKTIAEEKSISKAARLLFIAQPSLSQFLQKIEEDLGTPLFNRLSNGLTLTYAGERYYSMATQILKIYENFEIEISDMNDLKTGRIHLGTTNHLGNLVLPKILPRFHETCPYIELFITEDTSQALEQKLLARQVDFAIMHAPKEPSASQIEYEVLSRDPFVIVLPPDHPLLAKAAEQSGYDYPVLDVRLLQQEPFIMLHKPQRIRQVCDAVLAKAGILKPWISLVLKNYETAQQLAAQGLGITMVPQQYARIAAQCDRTAFCSIDTTYDAAWDMCIATLKNNYLSKADRFFIEMFRSVCRT